MASHKRKRTRLWAGYALILAMILSGVSAVNHACASTTEWRPLPTDALRIAFLVIVVLAIAVSFSGKDPEGRA